MRDRQRVPRLVKGSALSAVYVDNLTTVGGNRSDTVAGVKRFIDEAGRKGFSRHPAEIGSQIQTLGLIFDGELKILTHTKAREVALP